MDNPSANSPPAPVKKGPIKDFADRFRFLGPAIWMASVLYFVAQLAVGWVWNPPYSLVNNTISDLGNTTCGPYGGFYVCSPHHAWMNAAFILLGVIMASGSLLIYQEFRERRSRERRAAFVGFLFLAIGGLGTILVGLRPENTVRWLHITGAGLAIGLGNIGIMVLGLSLALPIRLRGYMIFFSAISLTALLLFAYHRYFGLGAGGMERLAAYPETIWLIRFGIYMSRDHYLKTRVAGPDKVD